MPDSALSRRDWLRLGNGIVTGRVAQAYNFRKCQECKAELVQGEPALQFGASVTNISNGSTAIGEWCASCGTKLLGSLKSWAAEAHDWLSKASKEMEAFSVARALMGGADRAKLTALFRKALPENFCRKCCHAYERHGRRQVHGENWCSCCEVEDDEEEAGTAGAEDANHPDVQG
jgi:hypothetical protein